MNDDELVYTRIFDAPRELVFQCMIEPAHLTHFWGPKGTSTPLDTIKVDARPGGVFQTVMVSDSDGTTFETHARYTEIVPPERLAWTDENGVETESTFVALDDGHTEVTVHQRHVPEFFRSGSARAGFMTSMDKFAEHLAALQESA